MTVDEHALSLSSLECGLLALLAGRAGRVGSIDHIIEALWGDAAPPSARNRVQALVSAIRRASAKAGAAADPMVTCPPGYRLNTDDVCVDLIAFRRLLGSARGLGAAADRIAAIAQYSAALQLWFGEPFHGAPVGRDFEVQAEQIQLQEERLAAIEERIELELELGRHGTVIPELSALVRVYPFRERMRCHLMLALARSGRQAEALATYRAAYRLLTEELGTGPGRQLEAVHHAVLTGAAVHDPVPA
jgi:DNA-binding SARP family transcriptional activator